MSEHSRETIKRQVQDTQKRHVTRTDLKKSTEHFEGERQNILPIGETPFRPRIRKHLEMLAEADSVEERAKVMSYLQQSYGNRYVQSLVESIKVQTKFSISQPGDLQDQQADRVAEVVSRVIATEIQMLPEAEEEENEEEEQIPQITKPVQSQIEEDEEKIPSPHEEEEEELSSSAEVDFNRNVEMASMPLSFDKRIPVRTLPDPATMGGVVTVKSKKFEAWINPGEPACILGGIKAHEEKHISDFEADAYYSTIPTSGKIADGHCVYYQNNADAKKFENAAIDVEIAWLKKKLEDNPSAADKAIIENRMNVTLPAYRASFG